MLLPQHKTHVRIDWLACTQARVLKHPGYHILSEYEDRAGRRYVTTMATPSTSSG